MEPVVKIIIFSIICMILYWPAGRFVGWLLHDKKSLPIDIPINIGTDEATEWKEITWENKEGETGGKAIGWMERILTFVAVFWGEEKGYILIAGWLAFKVASKWEAWQHIVQVPGSLNNVPQLSYLKARWQWGSRLLTRFLVGTAANISLGIIGAVLGVVLYEKVVEIWICKVR